MNIVSYPVNFKAKQVLNMIGQQLATAQNLAKLLPVTDSSEEYINAIISNTHRAEQAAEAMQKNTALANMDVHENPS